MKSSAVLVSATCEASVAGLNAFYQRKVESLASIQRSQHEDRDFYVPKVATKEFDEERHLDLALSPWAFHSMPGARSAQWPVGLPDFVERLEAMPPLSLWAEPMDTLSYGVEFVEGTKSFIRSQIKGLADLASSPSSGDAAGLCHNLGLSLRACFGFAVLTASSDLLIESLTLLSQIDRDCRPYAADVFGRSEASLRRFLTMVQEQYTQKNNLRYLDATSTCGVFAISKFVSFAQQNEHNTSIATDGEYLYMYVAIPQKAIMYKIGTGASELTVPGKIYLEKKAERDGDVAWTYCQGKLFARRASEEFGLLTLYDAETLSTIGDARLLCNDIFTSSNCLQANRSCPILSDGQSLFVVTMKVLQKRRPVKPDMRLQYT